MPSPRKSDAKLIVLYGLLWIAGMVLLVQGIVEYQKSQNALMLSLGVLAIIVPAALFPIAATLRQAHSGSTGDSDDILRSINERLLLSDIAKRIAYRHQDRDALRKAIREDIEKRDYDAALALVSEMSQVYGYRQEAEDFRDQILQARAVETERRISDSLSQFEKYLGESDWDTAGREAAKLQRLYPDSVRVRDLSKRVREARDAHKHDLERRFLEAAQRDDVELAMDLLKELDKYLSENEAAPLREVARGVIGKKRQNLGVQFKLAVHDKEWTQSVRIGEQIIREFPNSKMADEVRGHLDLLRERAAGEQAARPRAVL